MMMPTAKWLLPIRRRFGVLVRPVAARLKALCEPFTASPKRRLTLSTTISVALHLLLCSLLFFNPRGGFISRGTSGEGVSDGAGFTVDLVEVETAQTPKASKPAKAAEQTQPEVIKPKNTPPAAAKADEVTAANAVSSNTTETSMASQAETETKPLPEGTDGSGATGQSGQADGDLWSAIAPCWNRIADAQTLGATLTISFSPDGHLSAPPVIERDPTAPITEQSLQSEAKALAALAECGAYPMAKGLQAVSVAFPSPVTAAAPGYNAMNSHQTHLLAQYLFRGNRP